MIRIDIKPLSVNEAWQGRRFKSKRYSKYTKDVLFLLPKMTVPPGKKRVHLHFGFSNALSDLDNPVKPIMDIICEKYGFDDREIYSYVLDKQLVAKGKEFVAFKIEPYENGQQMNQYDEQLSAKALKNISGYVEALDRLVTACELGSNGKVTTAIGEVQVGDKILQIQLALEPSKDKHLES